MAAATRFTFENLATELLRDVIEAVAERPGESDARRFSRHQTAVFSVMAFLPRDAMEIMLAGQAVMFSRVLADGTRDLLRGQSETVKLRVRPQLVAIGNNFLKHLAELRRLQKRPANLIAVVPSAEKTEPAAARTTPAVADPRPIRETATAPLKSRTAPMGAPPPPNDVAAVAVDPKIERLAAMLPNFAPLPVPLPTQDPGLRALIDPVVAPSIIAAREHAPSQAAHHRPATPG